MVDREEIVNALHGVEDPELGMDIVELGLFYDVEIEGPKVKVIHTLTSMGCPAGPMIQESIHDATAAVEGVEEVEVELTFDPPWTPEKMSDDAKFILGFGTLLPVSGCCPQRCGHPLAELEHPLVQARPVVLEVDDEAVAAVLDVFEEPLRDPLRRAGDRMAAALVAPRFAFRTERDADAQDDAAVLPSLAQLGGQRAQLVRRQRHRVPDTRTRRPSYCRPRHPGHPELGATGANERRREPAVHREELALVDNASRHLLEHGRSEVEPFVEQAPAALEVRAEELELTLHPARGDGGDDAAAREQVERRQLLEHDKRVPLRDDERRDAELEPLRPRGEKAERHERFRDRSVHRRVLRRHDHVVRDPAGVEACFLRGCRGRREPLGAERLAVVRQDQAEVQLGHVADATG